MNVTISFIVSSFERPRSETKASSSTHHLAKTGFKSKSFFNAPQTVVNCENVTPFSCFELFFDDAVVEFFVEMTNLYARRDKGFTDFSIDVGEMRLFLCILLISGYNSRPRARMYWEQRPDSYCEAIQNAMTRKRFETILKCLHLCDNLDLTPGDKMAKVRPFYNLFNKRFLKNRANLQHLSVDEAMLPYFGKNNSKQRIQNKPVRVGYKMWVLAEDSGYVVQFDPYQGAKSAGPTRASPTTWGLGEKVVLELLEVLPQGFSYHVFMDNFFCNARMLKLLGEQNIKASGTLRQNRLSKDCSIKTKIR